MVDFQANRHWLVETDRFRSRSEYFLHLIHMKAYEAAAELVQPPVLDLGCNNGYGTAFLRDRTGVVVVGVDVSPKAIEAARARYGGDFRLVDGRRLDFADGSFGSVTSFQVIEHIDDVDNFLAEIGRVLRPGGQALFTTPNAALRLRPGERPWNRFHVREFNDRDLEAALSPYFRKVDIRGLASTAELEELERARAARLRAVGRVRRLFAPWLPARIEDRIISTVRAVLRSGRSVLGPEDLASMSTADLRYDTARSETGLNLLAVCER